jgi:YfiR/HmsC-like
MGVSRRVRKAPGVRARPAALAVAACLSLAAPALARTNGDGRADEYRVKAAVVYNIARFVEWPSSAFAGQGSPVVVCVIGADPFGDVLEDTLKGRTVTGRPVTIKRLPDAADGCHVVFITHSEQRRLDDLIDRLAATYSLTVSDIERFTEHGGIVGLATEGDRVRFDVNVSAAERARLTVSARVLALASAVRRTEGVGR